MVDYEREMTVKSSMYGEYGSFQHLLYLFSLFNQICFVSSFFIRLCRLLHLEGVAGHMDSRHTSSFKLQSVGCKNNKEGEFTCLSLSLHFSLPLSVSLSLSLCLSLSLSVCLCLCPSLSLCLSLSLSISLTVTSPISHKCKHMSYSWPLRIAGTVLNWTQFHQEKFVALESTTSQINGGANSYGTFADSE